MGLSYTIIPTSELKDKAAYISHFKTIDTYEFPDDFEINTQSRWPKLLELIQAALIGEIKLSKKSEENIAIGRKKISYEISHKNNKYYSDLTIEVSKNEIKSIHGIKGDFNMLLRISTEITKFCGSMIIFSAYDAYYIEENRKYSEIWDNLKNNWVGEE